MNEVATEVVVYFSEVPELREVLLETRLELESKGITKPTLRTKNGKVHTFDMLPEGFRVTDHLVVQHHVRCQVCTSEPPLRYEFQLQTTTGEWIGPVGSTCLFTQVLGKAKALSIGTKMQQHAVRESHNSRHRKLLRTAGNHYSYLSKLGLTWVHKPSMVENFTVPSKLQPQYQELLQGGIVGLELHAHLQQYQAQMPASGLKAPHANSNQTHPEQVDPHKPGVPGSLGAFWGPHEPEKRPGNVPLKLYQEWYEHGQDIQKYCRGNAFAEFNWLLKTHAGKEIPGDKVRWMRDVVSTIKSRKDGTVPKTIPDDLYRFYQDHKRFVELYLNHKKSIALHSSLQHDGQFASRGTRYTLAEIRDRFNHPTGEDVQRRQKFEEARSFLQGIREELTRLSVHPGGLKRHLPEIQGILACFSQPHCLPDLDTIALYTLSHERQRFGRTGEYKCTAGHLYVMCQVLHLTPSSD